MATEALERADKEAKHREVEEALRREEEGERSEVQRITAERRIEDLDRMEANFWRPRCVRRKIYGRRLSYVRRPRYNGPRSRQQRKGEDPVRACWRKNKRGTRTTAMRGRQCPERILTNLTRTQSKTTTSLMGTSMLIGMPSGAVAVMRRMNGRSAEAMGTRKDVCLRRRRQMKRKRKNRYIRRHYRRRGARGRTS